MTAQQIEIIWAAMKAGVPHPDHFVTREGTIECAAHVPYPGTDTWRRDRYRRLDPAGAAAHRAALADFVGADEPLCTVCRGIARRAKEGAAR